MGEYDFRDNLVSLAVFGSSTEAALAQSRLANEGIEATIDGTETATMLNHLGADLVGARVSVRQADLHRAREVLANLRDHGRQDSHDSDLDDYDADPDDYDADDWSGEDWSDDDDELYSEEPAATPPMKRAFRAAVIGAFLFPPLLTIYSIAIIIQHRLWEPQPGQTSVDWRFFASILFHLIGFLFFWWLFFWEQQ